MDMLWCQEAKDTVLSNRKKVKSALKCTVWPQCTPVPERQTDRQMDRRTDEYHGNSATIRSANASRAKTHMQSLHMRPSRPDSFLKQQFHGLKPLRQSLFGHFPFHAD